MPVTDLTLGRHSGDRNNVRIKSGPAPVSKTKTPARSTFDVIWTKQRSLTFLFLNKMNFSGTSNLIRCAISSPVESASSNVEVLELDYTRAFLPSHLNF